MGKSQNAKRPSPASKKQNANSPAAQQVFAANCAGCHGLDGKGGERAPDIVTRPEVRQLSDAQILQILQKGVPNTSMPSFSHLGNDTLHFLVAHLRSLQGNGTRVTLPGNDLRGKEIFFGKGACSRCHMMQGEGGFFASDLTGFARGRSAEIIHDAIVYPNRDLDPRRRTVVATLPDGKLLEGIARNEDNFSIQLQTQDGTLYLLSKSALANLSYRNESPMPADYGTRLSAAEIDDLVNYLSSLAKQDSKKSGGQGEPDNE